MVTVCLLETVFSCLVTLRTPLRGVQEIHYEDYVYAIVGYEPNPEEGPEPRFIANRLDCLSGEYTFDVGEYTFGFGAENVAVMGENIILYSRTCENCVWLSYQQERSNSLNTIYQREWSREELKRAKEELTIKLKLEQQPHTKGLITWFEAVQQEPSDALKRLSAFQGRLDAIKENLEEMDQEELNALREEINIVEAVKAAAIAELKMLTPAVRRDRPTSTTERLAPCVGYNAMADATRCAFCSKPRDRRVYDSLRSKCCRVCAKKHKTEWYQHKARRTARGGTNRTGDGN